MASLLSSLVPTQIRVWSQKGVLLPEPQEKEKSWPKSQTVGKMRLMRKDRLKSKMQTSPESTQVHNLRSDWGPKLEKPGAHRFTANPECWEYVIQVTLWSLS